MTTASLEQTALSHAVCETPRDDTPRLVLADWYEENGDETRANFIRQQCAIAGWQGWPIDNSAEEMETWCQLALSKYEKRWLLGPQCVVCGGKGGWQGMPTLNGIELDVCCATCRNTGRTGSLMLEAEEECTECGGSGRINDDWGPRSRRNYLYGSAPPEEDRPRPTCRRCNGSRTERGLDVLGWRRGFPNKVAILGRAFTKDFARRLFSEWPIDDLLLRDRIPTQYPVHPHQRGYYWARGRLYEQGGSALGGRVEMWYTLPDFVYEMLPKCDGNIWGSHGLTLAKANEAASRACVDAGRKLAGLPTLRWSPPIGPNG